MRRLVIAILGLALPGILVPLAQAPAEAATECWSHKRDDFWRKNCLIESSAYTGKWEAYVGWRYRLGGIPGEGNINITMWDRDNDYCTTIRVRYVRDGATRERAWRSACDGRRRIYNVGLNAQNDPFFPYTEGVYLLDFCEGKRPRTCINKWSVNVARTRP